MTHMLKRNDGLMSKNIQTLWLYVNFARTTSDQVGIGIGTIKGGIIGGIISFLGFTTPSVIILMAFSLFLLMKIHILHGFRG